MITMSASKWPSLVFAASTGKVDFQLVRNFVGGFIQMRRLLCNPKAWRELMKMNLEKLGERGNDFGVKWRLTESFDFPLMHVRFLNVLIAPVQRYCTHYTSLGFLPHLWIFEIFSIHQVGSWHCHTILCPPHLTPLRKAFKHPAVKHGLAGAFGYCLGGQSCLEQVRAGHPIQVSWRFHGRDVGQYNESWELPFEYVHVSAMFLNMIM